MTHPVVSLTEKDFEFEFFRGSGKGGQKRNKTSSACRCRHRPSCVFAVSDETRSAHKNKILAWKKVVNDPKFRDWLKLEHYKRLGILNEIEKYVETELESNIKVEIQENGKWKKITNF